MRVAAALLLALSHSAFAATYYVATDGSTANSGAIDSPWPLHYAMTNTAQVLPGDTVYLRGGTYSDFRPGAYGKIHITITGNSSNRLVISSYPGEWAIISDTNTAIDKAVLVPYFNYTDFRNIEITSTKTSEYEFYPVGIDTANPNCHHCTFTGLVLHDLAMGITPWGYSTNTIIADNLIYNCGSANTEHAIYAQNNSTTGTKTFAKNFIWGSGAINLNIYGGGVGNQWGFRVHTNVLALAGRTDANPNILVGGNAATNLVIRGNYIWSKAWSTAQQLDFGHTSTMYGQDGIVADNYSYNADANGFCITAGRWHNMTVTNNYFVGRTFTSARIDGSFTFGENTWDYNTYINPSSTTLSRFTTNAGAAYLTFAEWKTQTGYDANSSINTNATPTSKIVVIPFDYTQRKAWLVAYNYSGSNNVSFHVSDVLSVGDTYTIKDGFNWGASPLKSGSYSGVDITVPATNLVAATANVEGSATHPCPTFVVYLLTGTAGTNVSATLGGGTIGTMTVQ